MRYWVTRTASGFGVIGGDPRPRSAIAAAPGGAAPGDGPYISFDGKRYQLDVAAKESAKAAEREAADQLAEQIRLSEIERDAAIQRLKAKLDPDSQDLVKILRL